MSRMVVIGQWARYALMAVVGIAVIAWLVSHTFRGEPDAAPAVEPTIVPAAATPAPTPTADPGRRFLALDAGGVLWRGTAGSCVAGIAPTLERTTDAVVWRNAAPADAAELLALVPGDAADQAAVAIALTDGSCAVAGRHTNADGTAWEESAEAPVAPVVPEGALAVTDDGYVARVTGDCDGIAFAALDGSWQTCGPGMDPAQPIAIDVADGVLYIWTADVVTSLPVV